MITEQDIKIENFTHFGELNLILQIFGSVNQPENKFEVEADQYQPRRNRIWHDTFTERESFIANVKDTIERFKIGQQLLQDWLDGKIDDVYYYDIEKLNPTNDKT